MNPEPLEPVGAPTPAVPQPEESAPVAPTVATGNTCRESHSDDRFYSRVFAVGATITLAIALYFIIRPFIGSLIWAMFLAFLLYPVHVRLTRQLRGREQLSASLLIIATFILLIGPLTAMSAAFATQAGDLLQWAQEALAKQTRERFHALSDLPVIGPGVQWLRDTFGIRSNQIQQWVSQGAQQLPQLLAGLGGHIFLGAINTVFGFIIMLFVLFFFIRDGRAIVALMRDLVPMQPVQREQLLEHVAAVTRAVVFGTGITALVQGAIVSLAFVFTGLSSPLVFGVIAAILALLPFGGTAFVWIPAAFLLGSQHQWGAMITMLAMGAASSTADNILRPLLISGRAEVGTLTVFIGVLGGTAAFGPIGLFLGPVLLALIIALLDFARSARHAAGLNKG